MINPCTYMLLAYTKQRLYYMYINIVLFVRSHIVHVLESVNEHSVLHTLVFLITICDQSLVEDCFALWCADTYWLSVSLLMRVVSACNEGWRLRYIVQTSCYTVAEHRNGFWYVSHGVLVRRGEAIMIDWERTLKPMRINISWRKEKYVKWLQWKHIQRRLVCFAEKMWQKSIFLQEKMHEKWKLHEKCVRWVRIGQLLDSHSECLIVARSGISM